ncbi:non-ribosomal peptide synthetase [Nocardia bovistercoris]|nr:non-ribosomal peptide synthetase [Nocardia bovistercoris]
MRAGGAGTYPLTAAQQGWWLAQQLRPDVPVTVAMYLDLVGPLDVGLLGRCTRWAAAEFESPMLRVCLVDGGPRQYVDRGADLRLDFVDLTEEPDAVAVAVERMRRDHSAPLDPLADRATVAAVFAVSRRRHLLYLRSHHMVLDGVGAAALLRRTGELYRAGLADAAIADSARELEPLTVAEIVSDDGAYRRSTRAEADREYWREQLAGVGPAPDLAERGAVVPEAEPHLVTATLDAATARLLGEARARHGATFPELVIASFACHLARMTGRADITVTMPVTARPTAALRRSAGSLSNVVPLRVRDLDRGTVGAVVAQVRSAVIGALRHQRHRHEDIRRDHPGLRDGFGPVVNALGLTEPLGLGAVTGHVRLLALGPVLDLHVNAYQVGPGEDSTCVDFQANPARYRHATVVLRHRMFLEYFARFLAAEKDCPTTDLDVIAPVPIPAKPAAPLRTLPDLLRSGIVPEAVAVHDGVRCSTYRELDEASSRWARVLCARGAGPGGFVVVAIHRSLESVLALWAVAKSGACYVPVDPDESSARIAGIIGASGARWGLILARSRIELSDKVARLGAEGIEWIAVDDRTADDYAATPFGDTDRITPLRPQHAAYLIHTSGTTGVPKGVVVTHRGLGALTDYLVDHYALHGNSVLLHSHAPIFDAHLLELLAGFAAGAQVVVAAPSVVAGDDMARLINARGVTVFQTSPAVLATLDPEQVPGLRVVAIGGEACPETLVRKWAPRVRFCNGYGPTEATVMVTETAAMRATDPVTVGRPLPGVFAVTLDARLRRVPDMARGELYLGGPCLADGYLNAPAVTAARFVADPFGDGERLYRTGDSACALPGGAFELFGRLDNQLELRGRRIEPGEIEAALLALPEIACAVVTLVDADLPRARLVAHVVAVPGARLDIAAILRDLRSTLPPALVPTTLIPLDLLPLAGNGKIDRSALPGPVAAEHRPAHTDLQRLVADRIAAAVGIDRIGLDDDFFELGGNSVLGVLISSELAVATGVPVTVRWLYTTPTVAALAERISTYDHRHDDDDGLATVLTLRRNGIRTPLFCVHSAVPLAWCYAGLAGHVTDRPVYGLQATELTADTPTIEDLVELYLAAILERQPHGPYNLLGWSLGGQLAHAVAVRLQARGATVSVLAMLDSVVIPAGTPPPVPRMRDLLTHLLGDEPEDADTAPEVTAAQAAAELATTAPSFGTGLSAGQLERLHRGYVAGVALSHDYRPGEFDGDLLYFSATRGVTAPLGADMWRPYVTGELMEHRVDATHAQLTNTAVLARIGPLLARHLTAADQPTAPSRLPSVR